MNLYRSIYEYAEAEYVIERSRFIAHASPAATPEEARLFAAEIKERYKDATHNVPAFVCGAGKEHQWASDDGEPSGTSGMPVLKLLTSEDLTNIVLVITRYFGGIKLGAGGLIRAYGSAVSGALKEATLVEDVRLPQYRLSLPYDVAHRIERFLENNTVSLSREYGTEVTFTFALEDEKILKKIEEYTKGIAPEFAGIQVLQKVVS